ncbi:MAG: S-methyl-5'-thioadenosine phosphorylase [Nitrospirae bacterium]|nr:MAG: S-methyl-5'-thioadenosine phosphorylase [Nitrospirota bacterium]
MIGIIGGSGLYNLPGFEEKERVVLKTPYGEPSDGYVIGSLSGKEVVFLARHGAGHDIPPHRLNYRANIWGFSELGVERIIAVNAVGGISEELSPGDLVIPDQVLDFTNGRPSTFFDGPDVVHVDFTHPYCPEMRETFMKGAEAVGEKCHDGGVYVCTNGPRLETASEIAFFKTIGGTVVGMTGMPEAVLSREREMCYLSVSIVTNPAAGLTGKKLTTTEVVETMKDSTERLKRILVEVIIRMSTKRQCPCKDALKEARL